MYVCMFVCMYVCVCVCVCANCFIAAVTGHLSGALMFESSVAKFSRGKQPHSRISNAHHGGGTGLLPA